MTEKYTWTVQEFTVGQETRYRVVSRENPAIVLDDAQHYGFKSIEKAIKCYLWKISNNFKN